jgi:hypothetical protein
MGSQQSLTFLESKDNLLCSQTPVSGFYPEPSEPSPHPHILLHRDLSFMTYLQKGRFLG